MQMKTVPNCSLSKRLGLLKKRNQVP